MRSAHCHPEKKHYARGFCQACYMTDLRERKPHIRDYMKSYLKDYRVRNAEALREADAKRKSDPIKRVRDNKTKAKSLLKQKYGITLDQKEMMLRGQDNACAICKKCLSMESAVVDHSHETGEVRGLLCAHCNSGLGFMRDSIPGLEAAIDYLRKTELMGGRK